MKADDLFVAKVRLHSVLQSGCRQTAQPKSLMKILRLNFDKVQKCFKFCKLFFKINNRRCNKNVIEFKIKTVINKITLKIIKYKYKYI